MEKITSHGRKINSVTTNVLSTINMFIDNLPSKDWISTISAIIIFAKGKIHREI